MKQSELHRAVARATGETVNVIKSLGFQLTVTPVKRFHRREGKRRWSRRKPICVSA